jgi:transcriptional regulator with PAS, ATPase and Fis domain
VLLLELDAPPTLASPTWDTIQNLTKHGFVVLAYTDGIASWPVRDRCQALMAGAAHLLDSGQENFENELHRSLQRFLSAEAERLSEEQRIKGTMASLGIIGVSHVMKSVFRTIIRISVLSDLPTLLVGETGTGKELLAHSIHAMDPRRCQGPFVALNCAALAPTLAESELFGHRRGAFTGAGRDRRGLIRAAHGGVLFLDEIGELDLPLQAKLLRVLQENRVLSIGDEQEVTVNIRVVAATNRELGALVKEGRFREDLFHRLNVVSVRVPALRERAEDIGPLTRSFVEKYAGPSQAGRLTVAADFIEALTQAELPGNVRQLQNLVRQVLVNKADADASSL